MKTLNRLSLLAVISTVAVASIVSSALAAQTQKKQPGGASPTAPAASGNLITKDAVGPVRLGMTVAQARKAMPGFDLRRTQDGEMDTLIGVMRGGKLVMTLFSEQDTNPKRINERAKIESIEVWDSAYVTAAGVRAGMPLREVEQKYGKLTEIAMGEIEQREYAVFAKSPGWLSLLVEGKDTTAGNYGKEPPTELPAVTQRYTPSAFVKSISIRIQNNAG